MQLSLILLILLYTEELVMISKEGQSRASNSSMLQKARREMHGNNFYDKVRHTGTEKFLSLLHSLGPISCVHSRFLIVVHL